MMRNLLVVGFIFLAGCSVDRSKETLFSNVTKESGITFQNQLTITERLNPYTYRNFYNGAGVAVGDVNNDGLLDIYFTANQVGNKLYLNQGNFQFKDITDMAGVACTGVWSTGATMVDINADGFLDIYVCKSGDPDVSHRYNELFINNGDLTFTERSKEYGLDIVGLSVQAAFFDYDKDGDLDCYLLTNSFKSIGNYDLVKNQREIPDPQGSGNKFFINEGDKFIDYSEKANIYRSAIGFGLGITLGDFNNDTWTDIFVSNDFFERDYLYINDQHGAFTESLTDYFESISMGSMGADFADLDNDGHPELFVTEMLPDSLNRKKTKTVYENWNKYQLNLQNGYYHQFSRNVLQKNIGNNHYVEIGRLAGVAASEWSWGALLFDMNNDGNRDIFVANGIYKDLLDLDYLTYTGAEENVRKIISEEKNAILKLIDLMPSSKFPNYAFRNEGNLQFSNASNEWGFQEPMYSCGSAYGDFDNDGDLDLVVNNINSPSIIYRNNTDTSRHKSVTVSLSSVSKNTAAVGSHLIAYCGNTSFAADNFVTRGFQSSVQPRVTIGLGDSINSIDSLLIQWPDKGYSMFYHIPVNSSISVSKDDGKYFENYTLKKTTELPFKVLPVMGTSFKHKSSSLVDFNRDRLLPMMYSSETPQMTKGDVNGDGKEEVWIGGGRDQNGAFVEFRETGVQSFTPKVFEKYKLSEETCSTLLDVDGDGDLDLYMAFGGRFFPKTSSALIDKIFINDGKGNFTESQHPLPFTEFVSTSVVKSIDFDNDGDLDLLIGERYDPFLYGLGGSAFLFENNGKGIFKDVTRQYAPDLLGVGMVTDAEIQDVDGNGWKDIILVGDWMPIVVLRNDHKNFKNTSLELGLNGTTGWWTDVQSGDFNKDGVVDFVVGNHGLNTFFKTGDRMYVNDFDGNGSVEQIFCSERNGRYYPVVTKDELLSQLPSLKKQLLYYKDYGKKSMEDLFAPAVLSRSKIFQVDGLSSQMLLSSGGTYKRIDLPIEAQYSTLYSFVVSDFDNDGVEDVIAGGNQYQVKPQFGRQDASYGWFFKGVLKGGKFSFERGQDLNVKGQIRDIEYIKSKGTTYILFAKHDSDLEIYKISD